MNTEKCGTAILPRYGKHHCLLEVPRYRPFVLLLRAALRCISGMLEIGKKLKYSDKNLSQYQCAHHKSHIKWSNIE
jgi:hypothetical protein